MERKHESTNRKALTRIQRKEKFYKKDKISTIKINV